MIAYYFVAVASFWLDYWKTLFAPSLVCHLNSVSLVKSRSISF